jgi:hypothetical protein
MEFGVLKPIGFFIGMELNEYITCLRASVQKDFGSLELKRAHQTKLLIVQFVLSATPFDSGECEGPGSCLMPASRR